MADKKILLVENESIEAMDIKRTLESFGYTVPYVASSGEEAIEKALEIMPDLILMDIVLKGDSDGIEAVSKIKELDIPVIYLTAQSEESTIERAKLTEPHGYIIKPYDRTELKYAIELAIYKSEQEKKLQYSEKRYRDLFDHMGTAVVVYGAVDHGNNFIFKEYNRAAELIDDVHKEDILGRRVTDVFPGVKDFGLLEVFQRVYITGKPEHHPLSQYKDNRITGWRNNYVYKLPSNEIVAVYEDVTEYKQMEESLLESEQSFRALADNANHALFIVNSKGQFIYANPKAAEITGYTIKELLKTSISDLAHPDELRKIKDNLKKRLMGESVPSTYETFVVRKDNNIIPIALSGSKTIWKGQNADIVIFRDISDRKKAEEALYKSQDKLKIAMDLAKLVNWEYDVDSDMFTFDDRFYAVYGTSADEEGGNKMSSEVYASKFIPPEDSAIVASEITKALETDDPNYFGTIDHKIIRADGEERYITVRFGVIKDSEGRTIKTYGANQDITERKQAEMALRQRNIILSSQQEASIDGILMVDEKGKIISFNQRFVDMWSIPSDVIEKQSDKLALKSVMIQLEEPQLFIQKVNYLYEHRDKTSQDEIALKDGKIFDRYSAPMFDSDGKYYGRVWYFHDITTRKKADKTIVKRTAALKHANVLLKAEIIERKRMEEIIKDNIKRLNIALESANMGAWDLDLVNDTSIRTLEHDQIFGYDSLLPEWGAKNFFEHIMPEDREYVQQRFDKAYETSKLYFQCRINRIDNKQVRWIEVFGNVYRDEKDVPIRMLGVVVDITERKETEDQLLKVIDEKEMLLREIHHRVKNNMQIISSLLSLESSKVFDKRDAEFFTTVQDRVKSMGLIHGNLYQSEDLSSIKFKEYIEGLTYQLFIKHATNSNIKLVTDIIDVSLNMETAIPLGLIVNELVNNSLKYAFPESEGEIFISLHSKGEAIELIIKDNGVGIRQDVDIKKPKGLGLELVNSLVDQLEGTIDLDQSQGTEFKITFKELKYRERLY